MGINQQNQSKTSLADWSFAVFLLCGPVYSIRLLQAAWRQTGVGTKLQSQTCTLG